MDCNFVVSVFIKKKSELQYHLFKYNYINYLQNSFSSKLQKPFEKIV